MMRMIVRIVRLIVKVRKMRRILGASMMRLIVRLRVARKMVGV